jgi:hypothetical protein
MRSAWALILLVACRAPAPARPVVAWRLVEIEVEGGRQLVLERAEPAVPQPRIEVKLDRERASPGEVVEAEVWIPGAVGRHTIEVRPSRAGVRVVGPSEFRVAGEDRVTVRFTSDRAGRGGIEVSVRE